MHIIIIPGFTGHPDQGTFRDLVPTLTAHGHRVTIVAWPHFPHDLAHYNMTNTIAHARDQLGDIPSQELAILGFSMGGVIATVLAGEYQPAKLGLVVSPYQAGSGDDLDGKYKQWQTDGYRKMRSSKYGELMIPFSFIEDARQYNALDVIMHVHCPKLFVSGERDDRVPKRVTQKFYDTAAEPKEWRQIAGMGHEYQYDPEMLAQVNAALVQFVDCD